MSALVGALFCRFIGARFVAAGSHTCIAQIGAHAMAAAVMVHVSLEQNVATLKAIIQSDNGSEHVSMFRKQILCPQSPGALGGDRDVLFTTCVARWAVPLLARTTFIEVPHVGLKGCSELTSFTIAAAAFAFCGVGQFRYVQNTHVGQSKDTVIMFEPSCITVERSDGCRVGEISVKGIGTPRMSPQYITYAMDAMDTRGFLDEALVTLCRMMVISVSSRPRGKRVGTGL